MFFVHRATTLQRFRRRESRSRRSAGSEYVRFRRASQPWGWQHLEVLPSFTFRYVEDYCVKRIAGIFDLVADVDNFYLAERTGVVILKP